MAQENVEIVRAVYGRWSKGDFRPSGDLFDPNFALVLGPDFPDAGTYRGTEEVAAYMRGFLEPWTHLTIEPERIAAAGRGVLANVLQRGVGSTSGVPTEFRYFQLWTCSDRRVIRLEGIRDQAEALAAAGLPPLDDPRGG
ncbi:MAG: nuclear transport factor 2 family protein [Actinomycetota bacterium]|nr:nuclear transport factor 2 family protein [Actinomycetota bacterium]